MHFSPDVYLWLLSLHIIPNTAQQDEKGTVLLPSALLPSFENGFTVADIIRKVSFNDGKQSPASLANIKPDTSRSAKTINWNYIWIALDSIQIRMDPRIKELILQGEHALIVELVRQIYERDGHKPGNNKSNIRIKQAVKPNKQTVDMKRLDLSKNPEQSQTALQFLMLLLKTSLQMGVQQILGLFTNQNKYLAQIIVKGVNDNFDPIVLFYTLLIKHGQKLKYFYNQDAKDAQACLNAIKPGLISKSEKVVGLSLELFGGLGNIYSWFTTVETSSCASTYFLGLKRHPQLKTRFWKLLLQIIKKEELSFFTKCYSGSFQSAVEQVEITTILVELVADWERSEELVNVGVVSGWIEVAGNLREEDIQAQTIAFRFIGELMVKMGDFVQSNQETIEVLQRKWYMRTLPQFATLYNQLILILQRLGEGHSLLASRIYQFITNIAKSVGPGDKRDYLVENFTPLVSKFTTIPTEYLIQHFKEIPLSHEEFLLVCQVIEINKSVETMVSVGMHIKGLFLENPLLNFYLSPLLKEIIQKVIKNGEQGQGHSFIMKIMDEAIALHASLQMKYKSKRKHEAISFGKRETNDKGNKQEQAQLRIKQKWKEIVLGFIMSVLNVILSHQDESLKQSLRQKLVNSNNIIKAGNFKVGSRAIQDALSKRFNITKQQLHQSFQEHSKKSAEMSDSIVRSVKPISHVTVASRIKGPQNLTKEFQQMADRRREEEEERRVQELKKKATEQKKRLSVKKQLQISNILRGQIGEAQLRQQGFLQRLIQETKQLQVIPSWEIQQRDLQSIDTTFKKYHKVLRHLFLIYTFTSYNGHASQKFQDNQQRKEILTIVQLVRLLKDYKLLFLTSQAQIGGMVRDINTKLLRRREVGQLDYSGFQMFIVQFCALVMTRNHTITTTSSQEKSVSSNQFKNEPLHVIVAEFFNYLKGVFVTRGEKTALFDDVGVENGVSKEQAAQIEDYNKKVQEKADFILPKGFKKVSENRMKFSNTISNNINCIPEAYSAVIQIIDQILSQKPFDFHVIQSISQKTTILRVKLTTLGLQKERAMSTYIVKPALGKIAGKRRSTSKGVMMGPPKSQRNLIEQSTPVIEGSTEMVQEGTNVQGSPKIDPILVAKQQAKQKRLQSMMKLQELQKSKQQAIAKKAQQKQEQRQVDIAKEKQTQAKRREQTERFLQSQRLKIAQKRRKQEEQQQKKAKQQEQKQAAKRGNKERFKVFHQQQVGKIKKIEETALEKIRKERVQLQQSKQQREEQRRRLKSQIEEQDKRTIEIRKQTQKKIQSLYESDPIRRVLAKFQPNLRGIFDFLLTNTYISLTDKRHNNQIVFQTWRQFVSSFEFTAFVLPKDTTFIFKSLTKGKMATKDYYIGLTYPEFQQALLRLCIKYRNIFNLVAEKIKDDIKTGAKIPQGGNQSVKEKEKQQNEFQAINEGTIKDILKENAGKDSVEEWGEVAQVTDKTLMGMIYYLKVPRSKPGQEKRFRQIIARPHPVFAHQAEWLKEKLNEEYTLQEVAKKVSNSKLMRENNVESSGLSIK